MSTGLPSDGLEQLLRSRKVRAEELLASIVATSSDAILSKALDGTITSWNAGAERLFGYSASEMIGHSIRTLIPADLQYQEDEIIARIKAGERVEHYETERLRKDAKRIPISITISPIRDGDGRIVGASKIARDISERRDRELKMALLNALVESCSDAIVRKTLDGVITSWNASAERLFGYAEAGIIGESVRRLIPDNLQHQEDEIIARIKAGDARRLRGDADLSTESARIGGSGPTKPCPGSGCRRGRKRL